MTKTSQSAVLGSMLLVVAAAGCGPSGGTGAAGSGGGGGGGTGGAACTPGAVEACYEGPKGTEGVGICKAGQRTCRLDGSGFDPCMDQVEPRAEQCDTPEDEDCDGSSQSEFPGCCAPGAIVGCYSGPPATKWVGICKPGTKICNDAGTAFGPCAGEIVPAIESCATPVDDDCDGSTTDGVLDCCKEGDTRSCYDGPPGTAGIGLCAGGMQTCQGEGKGFGPCVGEVVPEAELCDTPEDESCNGSPACTGAHVWSKRFGNKTQTGTAAVDKSGNVALIGSFDDTTDLGGGLVTSAGGTDVYVAKLSAAGVPIFGKRFGNASSQQGNAVAFDEGGNLYLAGSFQGTIDLGGGALTSAGSDDVFVAKLDPKGKHLWSKRFGGASSESALYLGVDDLENVYVAGLLTGSVDFGGGLLTSAGSTDIFVVGLDALGAHRWSKRAGSVGADTIGSLAVDPSGALYLTGRFSSTLDFGGGLLTSSGADDLFLVKLDAFGDPLWSRSAGDAMSQSGTAVAIGTLGNVALGGDFQGSLDLGSGALTSAGASDIFVALLDGAGGPLWAKSFGDAADQHLVSVAVDATGSVILTGQFQGTIDFGDGPHASVGGNDIFVAKLDASGHALWSKSFGDASFAQSGKSVSTDPSGNILLAGTFGGTVDFGGGALTCKGTSNAFLVKLEP